MRRVTLFRLLALLFLVGGLVGCATNEDARGRSQTLYRTGTQGSFAGPAEFFTGDVQVDMLFPQNDFTNFSGAYVTFQPGARTAWHLHPGGQHMIVTSGVCLTGTRDETIIQFGTGETVWCPPDIDHWHGATPDHAMTHLVITGSKNSQNVIWKEKVTDVQYYGTGNRKEKTMADIQVLTRKQQAMIPIAAFTASGDLDKLKAALDEGLDAGLTVNEIKEIQVHLYAYAGFPRALNGLGTFMAVLEERKAKGIKDELGKDATPLPAASNSLELGEKVQTSLVGRPVTGPLFDFAPVINEYLKSHLFGDIFGRDVLDHQSREIVTVSALANMEGVGSQLLAHIGISLNTGLAQKQMMALAAVLESKVGKDASVRFEEVLQKGLKGKGANR